MRRLSDVFVNGRATPSNMAWSASAWIAPCAGLRREPTHFANDSEALGISCANWRFWNRDVRRGDSNAKGPSGVICRLGLLCEVAAGFALSVVGEVFVDAGVEALRVAGECKGADLVVFVD